MLLSSIKVHVTVLEIQQAIEDMWRQGYDPDGFSQLLSLSHTCKWIGSTEAIIFFKSRNMKTVMYDFHDYSTEGSIKHGKLIQFVASYFSMVPDQYPLYLQFQGHSITIVGIEPTNILVMDPNMTIKSISDCRRPFRWFNRHQQYSVVMIDPSLPDNGHKLMESIRMS
jgi:hypothetical protein